jgi:hypothetical protein
LNLIEKQKMQQRITQLNNEGVSCLQAGKTIEACNAFVGVSSILQRHHSVSQRSFKRNFQICCSWVELPPMASYSNGSSGEEDSTPFVFLHAVKLSGSDKESADSLIWAILYNLALACQLTAYKLGASGYQFLRRAHKAYDTLRSRFLPKCLPIHTAVLSLAIYNNMGCIYQDFAMHDQARVCYGKAQEAVRFLTPRNEWVETNFLKEVSLSLMISSQQPYSRAPAA